MQRAKYTYGGKQAEQSLSVNQSLRQAKSPFSESVPALQDTSFILAKSGSRPLKNAKGAHKVARSVPKSSEVTISQNYGPASVPKIPEPKDLNKSFLNQSLDLKSGLRRKIDVYKYQRAAKSSIPFQNFQSVRQQHNLCVNATHQASTAHQSSASDQVRTLPAIGKRN